MEGMGMSSILRETVEEISLLHLGHHGLPSEKLLLTYAFIWLKKKKNSGAGGGGGWGGGIYNIYKSNIIY